MNDTPETNSDRAREHEFKDELQEVQPSERHLRLRDIQTVTLNVTADLGKSNMLVRDVLALRQGSVVKLDKLAGEPADIQVNGIPLARGEVVVMLDTLTVRISEILGLAEKDPLENA